jgi:nitric oxide reductase NorQ protein
MTSQNTTTSPAAPTAATKEPPMPANRPAPLRDQLAALLGANLGTSYTVNEATAAVGGPSTGAVGNALDRLVELGLARLSSPRPRCYQGLAAAAGHTAASAYIPASRATIALKASGGTEQTASTAHPYRFRELAGRADVEQLRLCRTKGIPVLLKGEPGTGKTTLAIAAFPEDIDVLAGSGDTSVDDIIGSYKPQPDGTFVYVPGPLVNAMRSGGVLFVDDISQIPGPTLAALFPAMDGRRQVVTHEGETVTAAEGFFIIAGHNPGVGRLPEPLASRFDLHVTVSSDYDMALAMGVDKDAVKIARNLATRRASGDVDWTAQLRELLAFKKIADALGKNAAYANLLGAAPEADQKVVAEVMKTVLGREVLPLALGRQL